MRTLIPTWLLKWLVTTLTILMVPQLISGVHVANFRTALAAGAVLGVLNLLVRPLLILFTLPLTLFSLGIFLLFINAFIFEMAGWFVHGFAVDSFGAAFLAALIVSIVSWVMNLSRETRNGAQVFVVSQRGSERSSESTGRRKIIDLSERRPEE